jgi:AcrR family transcriptional regulator
MASQPAPAESNQPRSAAAEAMKAVALRLFAQSGINAVTVRQIAEAAGQKNHAAVTYYFGSKDALIRELIVDGAARIDAARNAWLDDAEADGGPHSVEQVMSGLVRTSLDNDPPAGGECYNRFLVGVQLVNRSLFEDAVKGRWNRGYQRCLDHCRRLLPAIAPRTMNQRLLFMGSAIGAILAARETELADQSRHHPMWSADATLDHIAQTLAAMIDQPE